MIAKQEMTTLDNKKIELAQGPIVMIPPSSSVDLMGLSEGDEGRARERKVAGHTKTMLASPQRQASWRR